MHSCVTVLAATIGMLGAGLSVTQNALAADCLQKHATYVDEDKAYNLRFIDLGEEAGVSTNSFEIETNTGSDKLKGWVIWNNGISRPNGVVTYECAGGDITGEELDKCQVWTGVVYTVWPDGDVDLLPPGDDPAAPRLLFPDFGRALKNSYAWEKAKFETVPWDVFTYSGCSAQN